MSRGAFALATSGPRGRAGARRGRSQPWRLRGLSRSGGVDERIFARIFVIGKHRSRCGRHNSESGSAG